MRILKSGYKMIRDFTAVKSFAILESNRENAKEAKNMSKIMMKTPLVDKNPLEDDQG